jgi:hypothetical protein
MKKSAIYFSLFLLSACNLSSNKEDSGGNAEARAEKVSGIYIFIKSKPSQPYDFLGSLQLKWYDKLMQIEQGNLQSTIFNISSIIDFNDNLQNTIIQVKQKYPNVEALIFNDNMNVCEAIKFK